jgi:hypothetical protein
MKIGDIAVVANRLGDIHIIEVRGEDKDYWLVIAWDKENFYNSADATPTPNWHITGGVSRLDVHMLHTEVVK